jgi:translation initiation factor IF-3
LCEITGTRYYEHNEEINYTADKEVRVFDENDQLVGLMKFGEAYSIAMGLKKDIVLRNTKTDVPIVKIMNYKLELLKRLFKKLGKDVGTKELKAKSIRLTTTISVHDLENKKRKSVEFLKSFNVLKFFMKVNVYEPENVQKGRLMLLNIAEDLKEYAKIKVSPGT